MVRRFLRRVEQISYSTASTWPMAGLPRRCAAQGCASAVSGCFRHPAFRTTSASMHVAGCARAAAPRNDGIYFRVVPLHEPQQFMLAAVTATLEQATCKRGRACSVGSASPLCDETEKQACSAWMRGPSATTRRKARRASQAGAGNRRRCLSTWMCEFGAGLRLPRSAADRRGRSRDDARPAQGVLGPFPP